jgi:hypothetical protein
MDFHADRLGSARNEQQESARTPGGKQEAGQAAGQRKQHAFGEQLPHKARSRGAQRKPYADLLATRRGTSEQQRGHIGAGNQQYQPDHGHQRKQRL